ncbi:hypothetical protein J3F83DRAFT_686783 [Trichoderma novae-zelandiae]
MHHTATSEHWGKQRTWHGFQKLRLEKGTGGLAYLNRHGRPPAREQRPVADASLSLSIGHVIKGQSAASSPCSLCHPISTSLHTVALFTLAELAYQICKTTSKPFDMASFCRLPRSSFEDTDHVRVDRGQDTQIGVYFQRFYLIATDAYQIACYARLVFSKSQHLLQHLTQFTTALFEQTDEEHLNNESRVDLELGNNGPNN